MILTNCQFNQNTRCALPCFIIVITYVLSCPRIIVDNNGLLHVCPIILIDQGLTSVVIFINLCIPIDNSHLRVKNLNGQFIYSVYLPLSLFYLQNPNSQSQGQTLKLEKNMFFLRKIVIFHTKYPKHFLFFKYAPPP